MRPPGVELRVSEPALSYKRMCDVRSTRLRRLSRQATLPSVRRRHHTDQTRTQTSRRVWQQRRRVHVLVLRDEWEEGAVRVARVSMVLPDMRARVGQATGAQISKCVRATKWRSRQQRIEHKGTEEHCDPGCDCGIVDVTWSSTGAMGDQAEASNEEDWNEQPHVYTRGTVFFSDCDV